MSKRFTDTEKWKKPFIRSLPTEYKLFWFYLTDDINHAGIWQVDHEIAEIRLGTKISLDKAIELFGTKVVVFDDGTKWFLPDFIRFQYGELNSNSKVHISVIKELERHDLIGYVKGIVTPKDKYKDKDKDKVIIGKEIEEKITKNRELFKSSLEPYKEKYGGNMLLDFLRYWGEGGSDGRLRYQREDTWELRLRLMTWQKNELKFNKK